MDGLIEKLRWLVCFCLVGYAWGQGVIVAPQQATGKVGAGLIPLSFATVTVCAANAANIPCTPVLANALFKDSGLTQPLTNPFQADINGNYQFAIAPGQYTITTTASGFAGYSYQLTVSSPAASLPIASQTSQALVSTGAGVIYSAQPYVSPAPNNNAYYIQKNCGSIPNCTQIFADGQVITDATTNSTNTITCPNSDCNFTAADIGKSVWAVARGGGASTFTGGTLICGNSIPVPTILAVNSAQSINISGAACTASITALAILVWGHKDGATLHGMNPGCTTIYFPANSVILFDDSFLTTVPACATTGIAAATGNPQPNLIGPTTSSTVWIATPDFKWADCTGTGAFSGTVCVGSGLSQIQYLTIWGSGPISTSLTNCSNASGHTFLAHAPSGGALYFVNVSGICAGQSGLTGAELNSLDDQWNEGGVQNVGLTALTVSSIGVNTQSLDNYVLAVGGNNTVGLFVTSGGQVNDFGSFLIACANVTGTLFSHGTHFIAASGSSLPCQAAVTVNSGGVHISDGDFINQDTSTAAIGLALASGGKSTIRNDKIGAPTGAQVAISNAGTLISQGGNTITSGVVQADFALMSGTDVLTGGCTGTATAASTLGVFGQLGQGTVATCTSTVVTVGTVMSRAGTVVSLAALAGTGGTNASSGVVTLLKNGAATTSTCTLGTGTTCKDFTHQPTYVAGDILSVQFTTQAADTLANVKVSVAAW